MNGLMWMPYQFQIAVRRTAEIIWGNVFGVMLFVSAVLFLVSRYGAVGSAWAWIVVIAAYIVFLAPFLHSRLMPTELRGRYLKDIAQPVIGSFGVALFALYWQPTLFINGWQWLFFLVITGVYALLGSSALASRIRTKLIRPR